MAGVLHPAALSTVKAHSPWALSSTSSLSPLSRWRRRRARAIRSAATDGSIGTDAAPTKKQTRKEKQNDRRRQQDLQQRQEQLIAQASLAKATSSSGGEEYDDDELPQEVFDRILRRIMCMVGTPMALGVALLNLYHGLEQGQGVTLPPWLSLLTILVSFGTSALGIAYGTLSASWDLEKEGSLLGIDEVRANWPVLWKEEIEKEKAKKKMKK